MSTKDQEDQLFVCSISRRVVELELTTEIDENERSRKFTLSFGCDMPGLIKATAHTLIK